MKLKEYVLRFLSLKNEQKAYMINRLPVCLELSDSDRAALYGLPDKYIDVSVSCKEIM